MEFKEIKGKKHYLYESLEEFSVFCPNISTVNNWRNALEGEWTLTDDLFVCQVLRRSKLSHPNYKKPRTLVRTVCGSFIVEQKTHEMLGDNGIAENIYAFSGNYDAIYERAKERKLNNREFLFARYVAAGENQIKAFKKAYPKAKDEKVPSSLRNPTSEFLSLRTVINIWLFSEIAITYLIRWLILFL